MPTKETLVCTHWGNYLVMSDGRKVLGVRPSTTDKHPSPIGQVLLDVADPNHRVMRPMVREGYLRGRPDNRRHRGDEPFVAVEWDEALDLAAAALRRTLDRSGNEAIFGGSYGWSSAGRFHHAQSQVHRFLNCLGGYVYSVNTYSAAAAEVILARVLGGDIYTCCDNVVAAEDIPDHCSLHLAFGGICPSNNQVMAGGIADHIYSRVLEGQREGRTRIVNIGPNRDDVPPELNAEWFPLRPGTDAALMLALAHAIETSGRVNREFLDRYTVGYELFRDYLLGHGDGVAKNSAWAAPICGLSTQVIDDLAQRLCATEESLVSVALSLQRAEHGEQTFWLAVTLAAMLGTFGRKGCGVGLGWGSNGIGYYGRRRLPFKWAALPQEANAVTRFIPVARISDMLLSPGESFEYDGQTLTYPEIELVYWAGGNPFHHHQDLHRLREAFRKPETIIVNEYAWTATAQHADIVFPACTMMERNDIVCGRDNFISPSRQAIAPIGEARSDYDIFTALSARLGTAEAFTAGLDEMGWLRRLYERSAAAARAANVELPDFEAFWEGGRSVDLADQVPDRELLFEAFRRDPDGNPLATPSGKIEIFSRDIADFDYQDCAGHPKWFDKRENLSALEPQALYPLHLLSPQPSDRLHSQFAFSRFCESHRDDGREIVRLNPLDATHRGIGEGDTVRIFNQRGACIAAAHLTDSLTPGVVTLATGAWFQVAGWGRNFPDVNGNPNTLTRDIGTSSLTQGPSAQSCLVEISTFQEL